jgi:tRNA(adenine34) deaminase
MRSTKGRRAGSRKGTRRRSPRRWAKTVTTVSTKTPLGLFTRDAATIARTLPLPRVSPKGPVSGLRMRSFFINRAGRQLSRSRRAELEKAKRLMRKATEAERTRS